MQFFLYNTLYRAQVYLAPTLHGSRKRWINVVERIIDLMRRECDS